MLVVGLTWLQKLRVGICLLHVGTADGLPLCFENVNTFFSRSHKEELRLWYVDVSDVSACCQRSVAKLRSRSLMSNSDSCYRQIRDTTRMALCEARTSAQAQQISFLDK